MTDEARAAGDEDRLPWLEAVEEEEEREGPPLAKLIGFIVVGLIAIGIVVGGLYWAAGRNGGAGGDGELIAAPKGDYKVRPDDPGGMDVSNEAAVAQRAAQGAEPKGRLDTGAAPEAPAARPPQPQQDKAAAGQPQRPPAQPAAPGATVQLGAFSSQAAAARAWTALSGRFRYLAPLSHSVVPVQSGGRTLYRLRASGPGAADVCRRLRIAGESCELVG